MINGGKESSSDGEREFGDDCCAHVALFTAGIAVLMAYFKRALMAVFLLEQWRSWVFLLLNLLLFTILVTSTCNLNLKALPNNKTKKIRKKKKIIECCSEPVVVCSQTQSSMLVIIQDSKKSEDCDEKKIVWEITRSKKGVAEHDQIEEEGDDEMEAPRMSKEEVNERAEAFILMFRQHLVLDAKKPLLSKPSII